MNIYDCNSETFKLLLPPPPPKKKHFMWIWVGKSAEQIILYFSIWLVATWSSVSFRIHKMSGTHCLKMRSKIYNCFCYAVWILLFSCGFNFVLLFLCLCVFLLQNWTMKDKIIEMTVSHICNVTKMTTMFHVTKCDFVMLDSVHILNIKSNTTEKL